ncbi:MAG: TonB-dependent receptor [Spongiibacteraceae bacterium]
MTNGLQLKPLPIALVLCGSFQAMLPLQLSAQNLVLEEVLVTAQIRTESLQDVPISVSAVSGEKLQEAGIDKIEDLQAYVPNLTMSETGIGTNIFIRGIGSGINQGFEQSTGMYIDGVSYGRAQLSRAPFLDLARVEVLRGPQNILFGKNSIAGALRLVTATPGDEFEGFVSALYEPEHGEEVYDLVLSGPITDSIGARLAYRNRTMDGYIDNITLNTDEPNRDEETVRLTLDWAVNANLDLSLKLEHGNFDVKGRQIEIVNEEPGSSGLTYAQLLHVGLGADASVLNNYPDYKRSSSGDSSDNSTDNITFAADYYLGESTLTFTTGFVQYEYDERCDCDFTGADIFRLRSEEEYKQFSQEIRFTSAVGGAFEYIGGVYFHTSELVFKDEVTLDQNSVLPAALNANIVFSPGDVIQNTAVPRKLTTDTDIFSVFLQGTLNITEDFRLTLGGRFSREEKDATRVLTYTDLDGNVLPFNYGSPFSAQPWGVDGVYGVVFKVDRHDLSGNRTENDFSPLVLLEYEFNQDILLYTSAAQGSKAGGFDARSNADPAGSPAEFPAALGEGNTGSFEFEDEKATSFEVGAKTTLLDGAAELNIAAFYTQYKDLQVSIFDGVFGFNVGNAGEAETYGLELDGRWRLTNALSLSGALAFLDFEFTDYPNGQCNFGEAPTSADGNCDYTGRTNQYVADWSGSISMDYVTLVSDTLEFHSTIDFVFTDDYNPSQTLDPAMNQDGFVKVNARIALASLQAGWEIALVGKNLTDEEVISYSGPTPLAGNIFGVASRYAFYDRPRSIALQGVYRF